MDLATLNQASGILTYRGLTLESKSGINLDIKLDTFEIPIDGISSNADERVKQSVIKIQATPTGEWLSPSILMPYLTLPEGSFVLPVVPVTINTGTGVLTANGHPFVLGDRVLVGAQSGGTLAQISSADVDQDTYYYVGTVTTNSFKLYTTRANALASTSAVSFSGAGTNVRVVAQYDLVLNLVDGRQITFHAAAITKQPDLDLQVEATPFGQVEWTAFTRSRMEPENANSIYTEASVSFPGWSANSSDIVTQSQRVAWAQQIVVESGVLSTDVLTATAHGMTTGTKVFPGTTGTFPTATPALDSDTALYVKNITADTFSLHTTSAGASAGTGKVDISAGGTGVFFLTVDNPPYTLQESEAGVKVTTNVTLTDRSSDRSGIYNAQFSNCKIEAKFIPLTLATTNVLSALRLQGSTGARGRSLNAAANDLSIFSTGMYLRINKAALKSAMIAQNMKDTEVRELTFTNTRAVVSGVKLPPGYIGTSIAGSATTFA